MANAETIAAGPSLGAPGRARLPAGAPWLALGAAAMAFANGLTAIPVAALVGMTALLVFVDRNRSRAAIAWLFAAVLAGFQVQFIGLFPDLAVVGASFALVYGLLYALPFLFHRLVVRDDEAAAARILAFPCAWVSVELLAKTLLPYGSWFSLAHVLPPDSGLAQWAAAGGTALPSFLLAAAASIAAALVALVQGGKTRPRAVIAAGLALALAIFAGEMRARLSEAPAPLLRLALVAPDPQVHQRFLGSVQLPAKSPTPEQSAAFASTAGPLNASLMRDTERAAAAGAQLISWSEGAAMILETDQPAFLSRLAAFAAARRIYLFPAFIAWTPGEAKIIRNRVAAIEPSGRIAWIYEKARPIYGFESQMTPFGDEEPRYIATPWGLVGMAICHDVDFPALVRKAGQRGVDLLLAPSNDWASIDEFHARMARLRAVENGFTLARATKGMGFVATPTGRVRLWSNSFESAATLQIAEVPVSARRTIYPWVGELFSYLALLGIGLLAWNRRRSAKGVAGRSG
jgi:apolipoprotein N-acyltransferase